MRCWMTCARGPLGRPGAFTAERDVGRTATGTSWTRLACRDLDARGSSKRAKERWTQLCTCLVEDAVNRMKMSFPAVTLVLILALGPLACEENACSPCAPGTYPSNPSQHCSACVPCPDAGVNASSGSAAAVWCGMGQPSSDASSE